MEDIKEVVKTPETDLVEEVGRWLIDKIFGPSLSRGF